MRLILLYSLLFYGSLLFSQGKKKLYQDKHIRIEYHVKNGLLNGKYISHYANGHKKAEGNFKDNRRAVIWTLSDSTGKIQIEHVAAYDSFPRNPSGYFDHTLLKEKDVYVEKRIWRNVEKMNNPLLFFNIDLFDTLYDLIQKDSLIVYKDEEFNSPRTKSDIKVNFSKVKYEIVSYKIMEDWFFDGSKNRAETRIIGIYPVLKGQNAEDDEIMGLGWIFFPQVRKTLASQVIWDKHYPELSSIDDIFWYRHFASSVYKEANVNNRSIAAYAKTDAEAMLEAERIELNLLEMEHDALLFGKKPFTFHTEPK